MSQLKWGVRSILLLVVALVTACREVPNEPTMARVEAPNARQTASNDFYYYQGQPVFVEADPTRIVVQSPSPNVAVARLQRAGIAVERSEHMTQAPDHWVLRLGTGVDRAAAATARKLLAQDGDIAFAENAYKVLNSDAEFVPVNRVIVKFRADARPEAIDSLAGALRLTLLRQPRPEFGFTYHVFAYPRDTSSHLALVATLYKHPLVEWADPDKVGNRQLHSTPSDPLFASQYYLNNSATFNGVPVDDDVERAWDITIGQWSPASGGLRVGVIGTGVQASHPDFDGRIISGYDAMSCYPGCSDSEINPYPTPWDAHETAVAGIIVGNHNGSGMAGIAPGVYIIATRIFRNQQPATDLEIANAINFTWQYKAASILSNSWGGGPQSDAIDNAIRAANSQGRGGSGAVVVFAAGNTSNRDASAIGGVMYPATLPEVVAVGAINRYGQLTNYTPEGSQLDIVAPSGHYTGTCIGDVITADLSGYAGCNDGPSGWVYDFTGTFSGTSAAAPQVSAVAALVLSRDGSMTASAIKARLYSGADPWGAPTQFGYGKINAWKSVQNVAVSISGPTTIHNPGTYGWTTSATGGNGSYSFTWEESVDNGPYTVVGTGTSYSRYIDVDSGSQIELRVTAVSGIETGVGAKTVYNAIQP